MERARILVVSCLLACLLSCAPSPAGRVIAPDVAWSGDPRALRVINGELRVSEEDGRRVLRLSPIGGNRKGSNVAMAIVEGVVFDEGMIEVDLRGNAAGQASFLGVTFGVTDGRTHEAVYFRPFNFRADDPVRRAHGVQYVAWPEHTWEALRAGRPGVYESGVAPVPDPVGWFHARVEVTARRVSVYVDGAAQSCLSVDRLQSAAKGSVGLWVDSQEGAFAGPTIRRGR